MTGSKPDERHREAIRPRGAMNTPRRSAVRIERRSAAGAGRPAFERVGRAAVRARAEPVRGARIWGAARPIADGFAR